jgi:hypothetical protein
MLINHIRRETCIAGKSVTVRALSFTKAQQLSANGLQQIQYQSLRSNRVQQASIGFGIWFGTRGLAGFLRVRIESHPFAAAKKQEPASAKGWATWGANLTTDSTDDADLHGSDRGWQ